MSRSRPRYVLDASVAMKWLFNDEELVAEARILLRELERGEIDLVAPDHLHHEVLNALRTGVRRKRLTENDAHGAMLDILGIAIPTVAGVHLFVDAFDVARRYDCAFYDALYLALAEQLDCPFVHADRRLHNILAGRLQHELWIENYAMN